MKKKANRTKKVWNVFWDLQCPYTKKNWEKIDAIKARFSDEYDFNIYLTSLAFHPQAFTAQCGASLVETKKGREAMFKYVDACFENQESFMNAALGDAKKSEIDAVFADIAEKAGLLDDDFTREYFIENLHSWENAVKPANTEHKIALAAGAFGTPKHQIDGTLLADTESSWGPDEWAEKLKTSS